MAIRQILGAAFGMLALSIANDASAQSAAVSDFKRFCMDTRADSIAAFAAADASGWINDNTDATSFVGLSGSPAGREINRGTTSFRTLTAGLTISGAAAYHKCVVVAQEPFDVVVAELGLTIPVRVGPQTAQQWTWNYINLDGALRSLDHMSVQDLVRAGQTHNPQMHVIALQIAGGVILIYSEATY